MRDKSSPKGQPDLYPEGIRERTGTSPQLKGSSGRDMQTVQVIEVDNQASLVEALDMASLAVPFSLWIPNTNILGKLTPCRVIWHTAEELPTKWVVPAYVEITYASRESVDFFRCPELHISEIYTQLGIPCLSGVGEHSPDIIRNIIKIGLKGGNAWFAELEEMWLISDTAFGNVEGKPLRRKCFKLNWIVKEVEMELSYLNPQVGSNEALEFLIKVAGSFHPYQSGVSPN
ncbi:MAG: hypothetical protein ABIN58_02600 [candidate division WOR-3 bacterium]